MSHSASRSPLGQHAREGMGKAPLPFRHKLFIIKSRKFAREARVIGEPQSHHIYFSACTVCMHAPHGTDRARGGEGGGAHWSALVVTGSFSPPVRVSRRRDGTGLTSPYRTAHYLADNPACQPSPFPSPLHPYPASGTDKQVS